MSRLPMPPLIPTRPDERWRVTVEAAMVVAEPGGMCTAHRMQCRRPAVAEGRKGTLLLCEVHLREGLMWIEKGHVVSWQLSK